MIESAGKIAARVDRAEIRENARDKEERGRSKGTTSEARTCPRWRLDAH